MRNIVLNETPVRTSKNYGINNIEIKAVSYTHLTLPTT